MLAPGASFGVERREALRPATADGRWLGATFHAPAAPAAGAAAVLLIPGWSGPRTGPAELLVFLARALAGAGHPVLRTDLHGRGDSSGRFGECDLDLMIEDASLGLEELGRRAPGAPRIAGGICSGANVALGLAALRPKDVSGVAAFSALPFQPARTADFDRLRRRRNLKQYLAKALRPATWLRLLRGEVNLERVRKNVAAGGRPAAGERNLKDSARDIERELRSWRGRALFAWGQGDEEAPPARAHFERLHAEGCASEARFATVAGANHNFYAAPWRAELRRLLLDFLGAPGARNLRAAD